MKTVMSKKEADELKDVLFNTVVVNVNVIPDELTFSLRIPEPATIGRMFKQMGREPAWFSLNREGTEQNATSDTCLKNGDRVDVRLANQP
jgi:hypothetical protein